MVLGQCHTSDAASVVLVSESSKSTPTTANIKKVVLGLEVQLKGRVRAVAMVRRCAQYLLANDSKFVILELLKRLLRAEIANDTRGVHHAGTKEPLIKIVTA